MKRSRFNEDRIIAVLKEMEAGALNGRRSVQLHTHLYFFDGGLSGITRSTCDTPIA
ncbi:MAG: hypothetical protein KJ871_11365 [Alphaproteobacteria bacterium]|nr:hypothetical protein [Alphaproteobacteria bacterium]MBU2085483.1 hypothetical protein [Alphaproteobacteria bacterium]MBU2143449.1 hypothetical protein [Alphaproteobacteria bacterium]